MVYQLEYVGVSGFQICIFKIVNPKSYFYINTLYLCCNLFGDKKIATVYSSDDLYKPISRILFPTKRNLIIYLVPTLLWGSSYQPSKIKRAAFKPWYTWYCTS